MCYFEAASCVHERVLCGGEVDMDKKKKKRKISLQGHD